MTTGILPRLGAVLRALALLTVMASGLGGCSVFLPQSLREPAPKLYQLSSPKFPGAAQPRVERQLVVDAPITERALDTDRIALKPTALEIEYYAASRWADRAPALVQAVLVEAFENANALAAVGRPSLGLVPDFVLRSELRDFEAVYAKLGTAPEVRVRWTAKLIRQGDLKVVAARSFEGRAAARQDGVPYAVEAFDRALAQVVTEAVPWSLQAMRTAGPARRDLSRKGTGDDVADSGGPVLRGHSSADLGDAAP